MNKVFNLTSTFKSEIEDDGSIKVRGMASTDAFDRVGDSISSEAWAKGGLSNFEKNPIILFNHDYNKPIGRATKVTPTTDGLHMEAKISKHAECADLIKDGVLGAFSVGFKVKDADYVKETDGLMIKDAELFEVSVVSVPCNQTATFSLAKSFDSERDYEDFKKTFNKSEENSSSKEIDMSEEVKTPEIDLEAFAKKVAEETAAKIAMKQAEQKAAEKAEAEKAAEAETAKALEAEKIQATIKSGIETGAEKLLADIQKDADAQKELDVAELKAKYEKDLKEKADELEAMRNSKRSFAGRSSDLKDHAQDLLKAHILGKITKKGFETEFGKEVLEKAGVAIPGAASLTALETTISSTFEEEVRQEQRIAPLFREITVTSGATVLPIAPDTEPANFATTGAVTGNLLEGKGQSNDKLTVSQKILTAHRLISAQFIDNNTDEQVVVNFLPVIQSALARAHAIAIDKAILVGSGTASTGITGLVGNDGADDGATDGTPAYAAADSFVIDASTSNEVAPVNLLNARKLMGKYGLNPSNVAYILPTDGYYELIDADGFTDITEVGNALATKLTGLVGTIFGSPVIATDQLASNLAEGGDITTTAALAVYTPNYVIPRLKGVTIETDYEVANQRNVIVATQSLGFDELVA